jgi:hypothetical protein
MRSCSTYQCLFLLIDHSSTASESHGGRARIVNKHLFDTFLVTLAIHCPTYFPDLTKQPPT